MRGNLAKRIARDFPVGVMQELTILETHLGGRDEVVGMLALAPLTPDLRALLGMLGDPTFRGRSLAECCAIAGILPGDLLQQLHGAALLKGKVLASQAIAKGVAAVAEDVMRRGAPYQDACHACLGLGKITPEPTKEKPNPTPEPCETCTGTGQLTYKPDLERQRLALEIAQLMPKGGGINIAQINGGGGPGGGGGSGVLGVLADLQRRTDDLLYGSTPLAPPEEDAQETVDAELLRPPDPPLPGSQGH